MKDYIFDEHESIDEKHQETSEKTHAVHRSLILAAILIIGAATALIVYDPQQMNTGKRTAAKDTAVGTADLATTSPDTVLLTINGKPITRKFYSLSINNILQIAEAQKLDVSSSTVQDEVRNLALANVINTTLLAEKAKQEGLTPDDEKVDQNIKSITAKAGSTAKLEAGLGQLGMTLDELRNAVANEILATTFLGQAIETKKTVVTEDELKKYYKEVIAGLKGDTKAPEYQSMRVKLEGELIAAKKQQITQSYLEELRKDAKIELVDTNKK